MFGHQAGKRFRGTIHQVRVDDAREWQAENNGWHVRMDQTVRALMPDDATGELRPAQFTWPDAELLVPGATVIFQRRGNDPNAMRMVEQNPPAALTPRGWSGGDFSSRDPRFEVERELFRTGRRVTATIVDVKHERQEPQRGCLYRRLTLNVEQQLVEVEVYVPHPTQPSPGDLIEVALGPGGELVLDTDERFYGPPGRLLVTRTNYGEDPGGLARTSSMQRLDGLAEQQRYQPPVQFARQAEGLLEGARRHGWIDQAEYDARRAALGLDDNPDPDAPAPEQPPPGMEPPTAGKVLKALWRSRKGR